MISIKVLYSGVRGDHRPSLGVSSLKLRCLLLCVIRAPNNDGLVIMLKGCESLKVDVNHPLRKEKAACGLRDRCGGGGCIGQSTRCCRGCRSPVAPSALAESA